MADFLTNLLRSFQGSADTGPTTPDTGPLTKKTVKQVESYMPIILTRVKAGQDFYKVAHDIASHAGVEPDQVAKYVQATIRSGQPL